ncbi:unnamed protein product [Pylaiella littoralis]
MSAPSAATPTAAAATPRLQQNEVYTPTLEKAARLPDVQEPSSPAASASPTAGEALRHSLAVGLSGGGATVFSVATLMWLHTIITFQQRHGTKFGDTCKILWRQGGPRRFYRGVLPSLVTAPLCRFGDTLSNELAMIYFSRHQHRGGHGRRRNGDGWEGGPHKLPVWVATFFGSLGAAAFHATVVPLDTYKVIMQVDGKEGLSVMKKRIALRGPIAAYDGALAFAGGSLMGHYPWYLTYNLLEQNIPRNGEARSRRARSAFIGAAASIVSAGASNALRVLKVYRQSHDHPEGLSYRQSIKQIIKKDGGGVRGTLGVFVRGLGGRVAASALQVGDITMRQDGEDHRMETCFWSEIVAAVFVVVVDSPVGC